MSYKKTMDYKSIYQEILNGDAILFVGAGFSVGNKSTNGEFKTGKKLAHYLCDQVKLSRTDNLNIACSKYLNTFSTKVEAVSSLLLELKKEFTTSFICETHEWLLDLPWKRIYTTNYDDLIENTSKKSKIDRKSINILRNIEPQSVVNSIIHINGYIHDLDVEKEYLEMDELFKITHESFFKDSFLSSDWKSLFIDDLFEAKRVVFLGYSLDYDFSLQGMVVEEAKSKCIFVDYSEKNEDDSDKAYRFKALGHYTFEGVASFSNQLKKYEEKIFRQVSFDNKAFEKISPEKYPYSKVGTITANEVFNFFIMGKFQRKFINAEDKVIINRTQKIDEVTEKINDDSIKSIVIHSRLGNGKSVFKHSLMNKLIQSKPVYELMSTENIFNDIENIEKESEMYSQYYIIIDDFGEFMNKLDIIFKKVSSRCKIILLVRTPIKDNLCNQLFKKGIIEPEELEETDINYIHEEELEFVYETFSTYGYWGNLNTINKDIHLNYYKNNCKKEFSNLSYFILNSDIIKKKIDEVISSVKKREVIRDFLLADAIISKIGIKLNSLQILEVLNIDINLFFRIVKSPELVEILDINERKVKVLSPIFSDYMLNNFENQLILSIAVKIYNNSSKIISKDIKYSIRKNLVSRSNIKLILSDQFDDIDDLAIRFYDSLRESKVSKMNPFYWLQYAISMLNKGKFIEAKLYFDNSYKISKEFFENPDLSHINTHYSRYLFEKELQNNTVKSFRFDNIREADKLLFLENRNQGSNLKYCLRQIKYYEVVYKKFIENSNNATWQFEYNQMIERIVKKSIEYFERSIIEKYDIDYQSQKNIRELINHFSERVNESLCFALMNELKDYENLKLRGKNRNLVMK